MQLKELPAGRQKGVRGPSVNVPADLGPACTLLPRIPLSAHIIPLKFKRRLAYKSAYIHDCVRVEKVIAAPKYLKAENKHYIDKVKIRDSWIQEWQDDHPEMYAAYFEDPDNPNQQNINVQHAIHDLSQVAQHNSFKLVDVPGDGSCMFPALSDQMVVQGLPRKTAG